MARILFAWELGGGMGHMAAIRPIVEALASAGHSITVAARDPALAHRLIARCAQIIQAPLLTHSPSPGQRKSVSTYAHLLHNIGYAEPSVLAAHIHAWMSLLRTINPDILVADASPSALLACRQATVRTVLFGTGFHLPPAMHPLPCMRFTETAPLPEDVEPAVLRSVNHALKRCGKHGLTFLGELFDGDAVILTSVPELDHYAARSCGEYAGPFTQLAGDGPTWPSGQAPRVFAYLKPFPALADVLLELKRRALPSMIYAPDIDAGMRASFTCTSMRFTDTPVDMRHAARQCDFMLSHAGYGLPFDALLAGKPVLSFPITVDQAVTASCLSAMQVGVHYDPRERTTVSATFDALLSGLDVCAASARAFAARYAHVDRQHETHRVAQRIASLS